MIIEHIARMFRYVCVCAHVHVSMHVWYVFVGLCVCVCVRVCVQSKITEFNKRVLANASRHVMLSLKKY